MFIFNKQIFPILCVCFLYDKWTNADLGHFCVAYIQAKLDQKNLLTQQRQYIQPMLV